MRDFMVALLHGPAWTPSAPATTPCLRCLPLALACSVFLGVAAGGLGALDHPALAALLTRDAPLSAMATVITLPAAIVALAGAGAAPWLLPLWLGPAVGILGWRMLPLPEDDAAPIAAAAVLNLPVMVLLLAGAWGRIPPGLAESASVAGASPASRFFRVILPLVIPGIARASAWVFVLALGVIECLGEGRQGLSF
jgi:ABC-type Fe3+ transport system permease subunit